jgi:LPXTG-motif cell wall-anchored protein
MKWLAQRQRERRCWTASASVAICGLVLGVIGIVPAFADLQAASCEAIESGGSVTVTWSDVPAGLAVTVLAQDTYGGLSPVGSDSSVAGFGPSGSWSGNAHPGAVAYLIHGDPADGGGTLRCTDPGTDDSVSVSVTDGVGATGTGDPTPQPDPTAEPPTDDDDDNPPSVGSPRIEATLGVDCSADAVVATLTNLGDVTGVAEIVADGVVVQVVTVESGQTRTVDAQVPLTGTTVQVFVGGVVVATSTLVEPCASETPDVRAGVAVDCVSDTITVTLTNHGSALGTATVDIGGATSTVDVAPGKTEVVTAARSGRTEVPVTVRSGGTTILSTTVQASCVDPSPELSAKVALICYAAAPSVLVTVTNNGDAVGSVTVEIGGSPIRIDVAAGDTQSAMIALPGDGPVAVVVRDADGEVLAQLTDQAPCETPEADVRAVATLDCIAGTMRVTLTNTGDADGVATVRIGDTTQTVVVAAAGQSTVSADVTPGTTVRVRVTDGQRSLLDETFSEVCDVPEPALRASVTRDCDSGKVRIVVANDGDAAGEATSTYGDRTTTVRVGPGESISEYFLLADVTQTVRVTGPGADRSLLVETQIEPCDEGAPQLLAEGQVDCQLGEVVLSIFNDGDRAGTVIWAINGRSETDVIAPGSSLVVSGSVIVGSTNTWSVTSGGTTIAGGETVDACRRQAPVIDAELVIDCGNDDVVVRVSNSGAVAGPARVVINGQVSDVSVPAGDLIVVRGDLPADGSYLVDVSSEGRSILTRQGTATDCLLPPGEGLLASMAFSCRWDEAVVRVENPAGDRREVTITVNGDAETIAIAAGDDIEIAYALVEDQPYEISVVDVDGQLLAFARGVHDCVDVGGTTVTNPDPPTTVSTTTPIRLPNTGANSGVLVGAGLVFIAAGLLAVRASQFRRDRIATA